MRPRVCVVSIGLTSKMIARELRQIKLPADFVFKELLLDEGTSVENGTPYDVFLSSGHNAKLLRKKTDKPVISITPSLYDVLLACGQALEYSQAPVMIIHRGDFSRQELRQLTTLLTTKPKIKEYDRTDDEQIEEIVLQQRRAGQTCLIGSGLVCEYAEKHGMHGIYLFPGESIRTSLRTAAELACSIRQSHNRSLQFSGIVNNAKQGIIMLDSHETVLLCNRLARQYLKAEESEAVGRPLSQFFPRDMVERITAAGDTTRLIEHLGGRSCVMEVIPILNQDEVDNRLLYIEDVADIQKTEREIRRIAWRERGFVARYTFGRYHSANREFLNFLKTARNFARTDEPVVILGETGAGKELLAQSIHNHSPRGDQAFVAVNCAAIAESLLESELFGYNEGAFTGARRGGKEGYFEMAHLGTIFLDEIGEMNPMLQSKLLRVIQEKQVLRVGGTKLIPFDARLIVATNRNLWELVESGSFRKDLYYRLNVLELEVPPLRRRPEDTLLLFEDFLHRLRPEMLAQLQPHLKEIFALLVTHSWPGNVRELENLVRTLAAHWRPEDGLGKILNLLAELMGRKLQRFLAARRDPMPETGARPNSSLKSNADRQIRQALTVCDGNVSRAAEMLGIHRSTLWRKLKHLQAEDADTIAASDAICDGQ